eukprot:6189049-Pleurochrysis_carterae.AAC.3
MKDKAGEGGTRRVDTAQVERTPQPSGQNTAQVDRTPRKRAEHRASGQNTAQVDRTPRMWTEPRSQVRNEQQDNRLKAGFGISGEPENEQNDRSGPSAGVKSGGVANIRSREGG